MTRKIIVSAFGGLALSFCLATSSFAAQALSDNQMDKVTAGQGEGATATLEIKSLIATGPTSATVSASNIAVIATRVGGSAPSSSASITATLTANAQ